jgi:hypothetical protein
MAKKQFSTKRLAIDKANATLMLFLGGAAFVVVFCLVASKALLDQRSYQSAVISKKKIALQQLNDDIKAVDELSVSYQKFASSSPNILGGTPSGNRDIDGENARIILDSLPSKYDFPALTSSLEKLLSTNGFNISSLTGTDEEETRAAEASSGVPQPIEMPFTVEVGTDAANIQRYIQLFERSIRPVQVQKLTIKGQENQLKVTVIAKTFFQPEKKLDIKTEPVTNTKKASNKPVTEAKK